jgi:hypothetical protein
MQLQGCPGHNTPAASRSPAAGPPGHALPRLPARWWPALSHRQSRYLQGLVLCSYVACLSDCASACAPEPSTLEPCTDSHLFNHIETRCDSVAQPEEAAHASCFICPRTKADEAHTATGARPFHGFLMCISVCCCGEATVRRGGTCLVSHDHVRVLYVCAQHGLTQGIEIITHMLVVSDNLHCNCPSSPSACGGPHLLTYLVSVRT